MSKPRFILAEQLPIVVGRVYVRRDGLVVAARAASPGFSTDCLCIAPVGTSLWGADHVWGHTGRVYRQVRKHRHDLLVDVTGLPAAQRLFVPPARNPNEVEFEEWAFNRGIIYSSFEREDGEYTNAAVRAAYLSFMEGKRRGAIEALRSENPFPGHFES